jgi:hypothetical protein
MTYFKRNNFALNIFASLSFWVIITPSGQDFLSIPWYIIVSIYDATRLSLFDSFLHFLTVIYNLILTISGILLLFSGFRNRSRTLISICAAVVLLSILFTPLYLPAWLNLTALSLNAIFILTCGLSLVVNILVYRDEQEQWRELKTRLVN